MLVFDMDGVLVEGHGIVPRNIARTVEHSPARGPRPTHQEYKNAGGWNDDWNFRITSFAKPAWMPSLTR